MKKFYTLLPILLLSSLIVSAQKRTIQGRIVSEDLKSLSHVSILQNDTIELGRTDQFGKFKVDISSDVISIASVGFETATIVLKPDCDYVELVLMPRWHIDFASSKQVDKFRLKEFEKIPNLQGLAYANGIFRKKEVCYAREFKPNKPALDSISALRRARYSVLKNAYKTIHIGDTIQIPFGKSLDKDALQRTPLYGYSAYGSLPTNYCSIYGIVLSKNKRKGALNLVYQVVNVGTCGDNCAYVGQLLQKGEQFEFNMKYYKLVGL